MNFKQMITTVRIFPNGVIVVFDQDGSDGWGV